MELRLPWWEKWLWKIQIFVGIGKVKTIKRKYGYGIFPGPTFSYFESWKQTLYRDPCCYCGGPGGTLDHIVPVARGGTNLWLNLTSACQACNQKKADQTLLGFLARSPVRKPKRPPRRAWVRQRLPWTLGASLEERLKALR